MEYRIGVQHIRLPSRCNQVEGKGSVLNEVVRNLGHEKDSMMPVKRHVKTDAALGGFKRVSAGKTSLFDASTRGDADARRNPFPLCRREVMV